VPLKVIVTLWLYQPLWSAGRSGVAVTVGGVLSMLIPLAVAEALLPALSVQDPVADWPAPSVEIVTGGSQASIPERASVPLKVTTTSVLFQPFPFGAGAAAAETLGGVRSMSMPVWVSEAVLPAWSVQVPVADWFAPSVEIVAFTGEATGPEVASAQLQERVTAVLFQPFAFGSGDWPR
jgi:hypothetical protein